MSWGNWNTPATIQISFGPTAAGLCREGDAAMAALRLEVALDRFERALAIDPSFGWARANRANVLQLLGRFEEAEAAYRHALEVVPDHPGTALNFAHVLQRRGRLEEALAAYRRVLDLAPSHVEAAGHAAHIRQRLCDWRDAASDLAALRAAAGEGGLDLLFALRATGAGIADISASATRVSASLAPARAARLAPPSPHAPGRLRLGYLSSDLRDHPVGRMLAGVIEGHDRDHFDVTLYAHGPSDASATRARLAAAAPLIDLAALPDAAAAARIREDAIDVLIDLNGITGQARPGILAHRPARVQAGWLGYLGPLGGDDLDVVIADPVAVPSSDQPHYQERIEHLSGSYLPIVPRPSPPADRAAIGLPDEGLVLCCLNNGYKITPAMFAIWLDLLRQTPGAVLWLLGEFPAQRDNLRREAGALADRLVFAPRVPLDAYLDRLAAADLFLDTTPCAACTVAVDVLGAGVPLLTMLGDSFAGRHAASLLTMLGLEDMVTRSLVDYAARARTLLSAPEKLKAVRARLASRLTAEAAHPRRFVRDLETLLLRIAG